MPAHVPELIPPNNIIKDNLEKQDREGISKRNIFDNFHTCSKRGHQVGEAGFQITEALLLPPADYNDKRQ